MNRKIIIIVSSLAILTIAIAYVITTMLASPAKMYVDPAIIAKAKGQDFTVDIGISYVVDLYAWKFKLTWDKTILDAINVTEGPFLSDKGDTFFYPTINNTAGYVFLTCTLLGNVSGVSGNGALATIRFHVKENGSCSLNLTNTQLLNPLEGQINHQTTNGSFNTTP